MVGHRSHCPSTSGGTWICNGINSRSLETTGWATQVVEKKSACQQTESKQQSFQPRRKQRLFETSALLEMHSWAWPPRKVLIFVCSCNVQRHSAALRMYEFINVFILLLELSSLFRAGGSSVWAQDTCTETLQMLVQKNHPSMMCY